ncbi:MAG TPA: transcription-repair coupling factor, partial [Candidatus Berkiella sp.]|nr:transcription-repair coupling factor [Candidatus Berkiella sp.]
ALQAFLATQSSQVLLCAESPGRREIMLDLLKRHDIHPKLCKDWHEFFAGDESLGLIIAPIDEGAIIDFPKMIWIAESQLYGQQVMQRRRRKKETKDFSEQIRDLSELTIGGPIVHIDHGVGRYRGLVHLSVDSIAAEYLLIEYADNDKLYVPVASLELISQYSGAQISNAPLHKLGTEQWDKAKKKASQKAHDVAAELLDIYAKRGAKKGHQFEMADTQYFQFASSFPFEETEDQAKAIAAVLEDMRSEKSMDRLVCGDVGFGKTEVALRAAFVAVQDSKQVVLLVPTTLLAQQHYETFVDRFADWPVRIEVLSRFRSKKEQEKVLAELAAGSVDIIVGTHKLIQEDVKLKNLGLVIIDEEHRFGVRQKERLKALRQEVDILTLTATPIPRTLNMALSSLRDLSIIATPPAKRLSIKTFVREYHKPLVLEAIMRELMRGGQVYYLHNDVETIEKVTRELSEELPQARVAYAHGQMRERQLEHVMSDFYHQRFNVLVCTTIIETGIDVPSANTIIIDRADKLGLAQLHQLRGRVGRSHHQAYAYCLTPPQDRLTADANKRLQALESLEELGSGFTLASHDLEIRGAGELLGEEQSGDMNAIGFSLYMELLDRA